MLDWKTLGATFVAIFLAEIGDKTQLATLSLAAGGGRGARLSVFIGSALALCATSALAVIGGETIAQFVSPVFLRRAAGVMFVVLGIVYLWPR
jgi:putative Ca2+/H+ antiporter (TMEM165/GDT1 family)